MQGERFVHSARRPKLSCEVKVEWVVVGFDAGLSIMTHDVASRLDSDKAVVMV